MDAKFETAKGDLIFCLLDLTEETEEILSVHLRLRHRFAPFRVISWFLSGNRATWDSRLSPGDE